MAEYVDKEIAYARLSIFGMNVQKMVTELPKANVKEIVYAHWEKADGMGYYRCSHCKTVDDKYYQPEYCPHCGAEMSEVVK